MSIERRNLIQILGAGLASGQAGIGQHRHEANSPPNAAADYKPRALTEAEYQVVDRLADLILPADETSPGAHDAGVARYVDIVLLYSDQSTQASWKAGVAAMDTAAKEAHGRPFIELTREEQTGILQTIAGNETNPTTQLERFFGAVKALTIEAFYLSAAGRTSLGYKGNTAIQSFPGCTHPEHQS